MLNPLKAIILTLLVGTVFADLDNPTAAYSNQANIDFPELEKRATVGQINDPPCSAHSSLPYSTPTKTNDMNEAGFETAISSIEASLHPQQTLPFRMVPPIEAMTTLLAHQLSNGRHAAMPATSILSFPVGAVVTTVPMIYHPPATVAPNQTPYAEIETCFEQVGGLQANDQIQTGCGSVLCHAASCYDSLLPWNDPYNNTQSQAFQHCFCNTSDTKPFDVDNTLWRNFTGCADCLNAFGGISIDQLWVEQQRFTSFCSSQNPLAYLFLRRFNTWLGQLHPGVTFAKPPLSGAITDILNLRDKYTTTPPLANIAYGASAPFDGSLGGMEPSLVTFTTEVAPATVQATITSLIGWTPTAEGTLVYNGQSASATAEAKASNALESALASMASAMVADGPQQGGVGSFNCTNGRSCNSGVAKTENGLVKGRLVVAWIAIMIMLFG